MGDARSRGVPAGEAVALTLGLGDRATDTSTAARRAVLLELLGLWLVALLLMRAVLWVASLGLLPSISVPVAGASDLDDWLQTAIPILFIYAPVALCRFRGADSWAYRLSIPAFGDGPAWKEAFVLNLRAGAVLVLPFLVGYHVYQTQVFGFAPGHGWPKDAATLVLYQVFFTAIPEEFFYRGYFQTRLNEVFPRRFVLFGTAFGWGLPIATLFFAFGHSVVEFQWWHFATFFPGLVFAWMRERTGGVISGALFHAACNVLVIFLDTQYGIR